MNSYWRGDCSFYNKPLLGTCSFVSCSRSFGLSLPSSPPKDNFYNPHQKKKFTRSIYFIVLWLWCCLDGLCCCCCIRGRNWESLLPKPEVVTLKFLFQPNGGGVLWFADLQIPSMWSVHEEWPLSEKGNGEKMVVLSACREKVEEGERQEDLSPSFLPLPLQLLILHLIFFYIKISALLTSLKWPFVYSSCCVGFFWIHKITLWPDKLLLPEFNLISSLPSWGLWLSMCPLPLSFRDIDDVYLMEIW